MAQAVRKDFPYQEILCTPGPNRPQSPNLISDGAERSRDPAEIQLPHQGTTRSQSIRDKVSATRPMIRDANGHRRLKVDPHCKRVIRPSAIS